MMRSVLLGLLLQLTAALAADDECGLYFAESTTSTPEEFKWGVFAGVDYNAGDQIGPNDIAIQLHNLMANSLHEDDDEDEEDPGVLRLTAETIERYTWVADSSGANNELKDGKINTAIPGTSMHAAFNQKLTNAGFNHSSSYFRPPVGESRGLSHPGRGASSHFFNVGLTARGPIPAGNEIFMDYGENFEDHAEKDEVQLTVDEHNKVDQLVDSMIEFMEKYKDELDNKAKSDIYKFLVHDVMQAAAGDAKGKKVESILPESPDDLPLVKKAGGSLSYASPQIKHDLEWLKKEGICMDNLVMGESTIPNAGRGAFAKRSIAKGDTIAPVPLLQIPDKSALDMHAIEEDDGFYFRKDDKVVHQQLLLNYCYGHPESNLLFLPTGGLVPFINHSSKKPNAKLVWSKLKAHNTAWLDLEPSTLVDYDYSYIGLVMELVATKKIKEGEEILMDYGKEWQEAWDAHVKDWNDKTKSGEIPSEWPLKALDVNEEYRSKPFKTPAELEQEPYPENLDLMCFLSVDADEDPDENGAKSFRMPTRGSIFEAAFLFPCSVKERVDIESKGTIMPYNYTVLVEEKVQSTVKHVPHKALIFLDAPETSDQFTTGTFRHPIGFPDDLFPKAWRDLTATMPAVDA